MSSLLTIKGYNTGVRYSLEKDVTQIGRADENTIQLLDNNVSRFHAEIHRNRMSYTLRDRTSRNGVFVNGKKVEERILRRNDEIVIGATHFLFDSDFELKNTLFSNKSVYMSAAGDETIYQSVDRDKLEGLDEYQRGGLQLIERISNLVASSEVDIPAVSHEILTNIIDIIGARRGVVMRWDPAPGELVPLAAVCEEDQLTLNRGIIQQVFHERKAIMTSEVEVDLRYAEKPDTPDRPVAAICAPVGTENKCDGVIYLDSDHADCFSLRDVGTLVAVGRLFYLAMQVSQLHDRFDDLDRKQTTEMIGRSRVIEAVREQAKRIAEHDTPVLITGETGTGKELLAREIHTLSPRRDKPFVAINCSAIPETLIESELFGYEKGAFTGADKLTRGKIEVASGGTLFLDEIGEMSLSAQPKLLRFLQNQIFYRVGGTRPIRSDVRIVAATNADLRHLSEKGQFRSDLMFRLNVIELNLPPLRERRDDLSLLIDHFIKRFSSEMTKHVEGVTDEALAYLGEYGWPGNIRELANCVERAILLTDRQKLDVADFATSVRAGPLADRQRFVGVSDETQPDFFMPYRGSLSDVERTHILAALERNQWNQVRTADELGIHRNTLRNKIQEYGLKKSG